METNPKNGNLFFWQPKKDYLKLLTSSSFGRKTLIVLNYFIWLFLFYVSYLLIKSNANLFWQILLATIIAEATEKIIKSKIFWNRPMFERKDPIPPGLVKKWYQTGSFPSGHTTKAVYFFLFILTNSVINPISFLLVTIPLIIFRVLVGFHYPVDIIGGVAIGIISWLLVYQITFPPFLVESIRLIFNFVFLIK